MRGARPTLTLALAALTGGLVLTSAPAAQAAGDAGAVYVLSNQPTGNAVIEYARSADGTLTLAGSHPTTGTGTGAGLGSQNAVVVDETHDHVYAVDAGSSSITSFRVTGDGLHRIGTVPSGGTTPTSITVHEDRLYVLNVGGAGNISGFSVSDGALSPLAGSTRPLSGSATNPAQVSFTPDGSKLLVTERATNLVDVYRLAADGTPVSRVGVPSSGAVPFGFDFDNKGHALVSEAAASTTSSYAVNDSGLATISASVPNLRTAACWLVATSNGKFAYTGNGGGSQSVSGYRVQPDGSLSLVTPDGRTGLTTAGVSDLALSGNSQFLYGRLGNGSVAAFAVQSDGDLTKLSEVGGLPAGAAGIAAR